MPTHTTRRRAQESCQPRSNKSPHYCCMLYAIARGASGKSCKDITPIFKLQLKIEYSEAFAAVATSPAPCTQRHQQQVDLVYDSQPTCKHSSHDIVRWHALYIHYKRYCTVHGTIHATTIKQRQIRCRHHASKTRVLAGETSKKKRVGIVLVYMVLCLLSYLPPKTPRTTSAPTTKKPPPWGTKPPTPSSLPLPQGQALPVPEKKKEKKQQRRGGKGQKAKGQTKRGINGKRSKSCREWRESRCAKINQINTDWLSETSVSFMVSLRSRGPPGGRWIDQNSNHSLVF